MEEKLDKDFSCLKSRFFLGEAPLSTELQKHLEHCEECTERDQHFQALVQALSQLPPVGIPAFLRERPLDKIKETLGLGEASVKAEKIRLSFWERLHWGIRLFVQWMGLMFFIGLTLSLAPWLQSVYQKQGLPLIQAFWKRWQGKGFTPEEQDWFPPLLAYSGKVLQGEEEAQEEGLDEEGLDDDFVNEEDLDLGGKFKGLQLWRFMLQAMNPEELRTQVSQLLKKEFQPEEGINPLEGVRVPGGIEFTVQLSQEKVPLLKKKLENFLSQRPKDFSWYRVASKKELPPGKAQVVIWVFQPH